MTRSKAAAVWGPAALIVVLVGWQLYTAGPGGTADGATLIEYGARKANFGFPQAPWRLGASLFLHGGWLHLFANVLLISLWGGQLARMVGSAGMLAVFLVAGLWGNLVSDMFGPEALAVGASGGALGLVLAVLVMALWAPGRAGWGGQATGWARSSVAVVVLNIVMGLGLTGVATARLDHWAHLGGAVAGLALGAAAAYQERPRPLWLALVSLASGGVLLVWSRGPAPFGWDPRLTSMLTCCS